MFITPRRRPLTLVVREFHPHIQDNEEAKIPQSRLTSRTGQSTSSRNMNFATAKSQILGSEGQSTHINTSSIAGAYPMSNIIYGFGPESGQGCILFQVFL